MNNQYQRATNKLKIYFDAVSWLTASLGPQNVELLRREMGGDGFNVFIQDIHDAQSIYPMYQKVASITNDDELKELYQTAANEQTKIKAQSLDVNKLAELAQTIYDTCKRTIKSDSKIQKIYENWNNATFKDKANFFEAINSALSKEFNLQSPKLLFFLNAINLGGVSLPRSILINLGARNAPLGLICHEFTHYLQRNNQTPAKEQISTAEQFYITPTLIHGANRGKFREFIFNNIYRNSVIEAEAIFVQNYVQDREIGPYIIYAKQNDAHQ